MKILNTIVNLVIGLSFITWVMAGAVISITNIWGQPSESWSNVATATFVVMISVGIVNLIFGKNKIKTNIINRVKRVPKEPKIKSGCSKCQKKKTKKV
jgi:uncharacterized membrane protein YdfJ with MMPL/SSD domain